MDISIVVVSWNTSKLLEKCLESIFDSRGELSLEVFVVDNNSSDDTLSMIGKKFSTVQTIENKSNFGFAKANNQAISKATGKYILLLNPDTQLNKDTLISSFKFMEANSKCGVMGPKMTFSDGSFQPSVRRFPTPWPIFLMLLKLPKVFKNLKSIDKYLYKDFDYEKLQEVDQVMGAYMFMPKKVLDKVGVLDERFFIWFEEVDLCKRVVASGYKVIYNPNISIVHHGGSSFSQQGIIKKQLVFFKSAMKYFLKHGLK